MKIDFNDLGLIDYNHREKKDISPSESLAGAKDFLKKAACSVGEFTGRLIKEIDIPSVCKLIVKEKIFTSDYVREIAKDTYILRTDMLFNSFLFVGSERALLVDTGFGIDGLEKEVRKITDKPLTVAVTHGHFGCVGGAGAFDTVKVHKRDLKLARAFNNRLLRRVLFFASPSRYYHKYTFDDLVTEKPVFSTFTKRELKNGISLGNKVIEVKSVPSHTRGSLAFIDRNTDIAVVGDIITPLGITLLPGSCDIATYSKNLEEFMNIAEDCTIFCSYLKTPLDRRKVDSFKNLVYRTSNGENDYTRFAGLQKSSDYLQFLVYHPYKIRHKSLFERLRK